MGTIYGYCRVSTKQQKIERQEANILKQFPTAKIYKEAYTGRKVYGRKVFEQLIRDVKPGDTIVFDEVSRMSRNAEEGFALYRDLYDKGISLVFLKEPHINTETYKQALQNQVSMTGSMVDLILKGINDYLMALAKEQIKMAFEQAQKEVDYLSTRTREGMAKAKEHGHVAGRKTGSRVETKKAKQAKQIILRHNKDFGGSLTNEETWTLAQISKMTFYKYKNELLQDADK